jgi:predicted nucleotidyltransferase
MEEADVNACGVGHNMKKYSLRGEQSSMFTKEFRDYVRQRVVEMARADTRVTGGALTGSTARGEGDEWSDVDVAFGIADGNRLEAVLDDWTLVLDQEFSVVNHFDVRAGKRIFRVFLLASGLQVDVSVMPTGEFGAYGPEFRALFGMTHQQEAMAQPDAAELIGSGWLYDFHARVCIERNQPWKAEYYISGVRDQVIALACLRLGENAIYGRGVDRLPSAVTDPLKGALVRSLDTKELRRALAMVTRCLIAELEEWDKQLSARLAPLLREFGISQDEREQARASELLEEKEEDN